ncbi:MAG: phosphoribosylformylglycinamidine cyclo-ligase [Candidatus Puniceispirillaceae bacterium]
MVEKKNAQGLTYRDAGVDIDAGEALVDAIKPDAKRTMRPGSNPELGGFGGLFDLKAAGYKDPILVSGTDGVGTKLEIAQTMNYHRTLGIDLVAMCSNDILAQGAIPLFFLDYFSCGKLDVATGKDIVAGIADGCLEAGCALIGGETAEMPGVYDDGAYDLAGFCVGAVERDEILTKGMVSEGDKIIALPSSGVHANGFSLVRKIIAVNDLSLHDPAPFASHQSLGMALLAPTRIYTDAVMAAMKSGGVSAVAHITGGGLIENPPRAYDDSLAASLSVKERPLPPLFQWLKQAGNLTNFELTRTFNCGVGMLVFVKADKAQSALDAIIATGEDAYMIGEMVRRDGDSVLFNGIDEAYG